MSYNIITLCGRLTRDPEVKNLGGHDCTVFSIAVDKFKADADGNKASFFDCIASYKTGEYVSNYGLKGRLIIASGRMESKKKDDKTYWTVRVENATFLDRSDQAATAPAAGDYDPFAQDD